MDAESNATQITFVGHVELGKYRYLYFVIMLIAYILIILSNSTIIYLIWIHRNLHEPMYIYIAALSLNSVLFSTGIYPKLLIDFISEKQVISYSACAFQSFVFYSLGCSDFLLLAAMAFDRYVSICKPLQYPTIMGKTTVSVFLGVAWLLPACEVAVICIMNANKKLCNFTFAGIFCNNSIGKLRCEISRPLKIYALFILVNIALLPVVFILFTYIRILIIALTSSGEVRKKAAETCLPHLLVLICFSSLSAYDVIIDQLHVDPPKTLHFLMSIQIILYNPLFNPIIYGLKMKEISRHLKSLFHFKLK